MKKIIREGSYIINVQGNAKMQTVRDNFKLESKYHIKQISTGSSNYYEYLVTEIETKLLDYQDPMTLQIIEYANKVGKIYKNLHIHISNEGRLEGILNVSEIKERWKEVKDEIIRFNPISSYEIIKQKEIELSDVNLIKENVKYIHFVYLWLSMFGKQGGGLIQRNERDRLGIGYMTPIEILHKEENGMLTMNAHFNKKNESRIDKSYVKKVSQQQDLHFMYDAKGKFNREEGFWLKDVELNIFEQLSEQYKIFLYLEMKELSNPELKE